MNIRCFYRLATPTLFGAALLLLAACSHEPQPAEEDVLPGEVETMVLRAEIAGPETRTALSDRTAEGDYKVLWKEGDRISVNGTVSDAVSSTDDGKKEVSFILDGSFAAPYKVLYPGTTSLYQIVLPAAQSYVAGNFDPAAAASYGNAWKDGDTFHAKLNNFCGVLRFALHGSATLDRMEIKALGGEKLFGTFTLAANVSDGFTGAFSGGEAGTLTYNIDGVTLSSGDTYFYVSIPAQTYSAGIEALVYQTDGAFMRLKFWGNRVEGKTLANDELVEFESKTYAAGRTENLFSIADLNAEDGGEPTAEAPGITVATYNIMRFRNEERSHIPHLSIDKENVQTAIGNAMKNTHADLIGLNEIDEWSTSRNDDYEEGDNRGKYSLEELARNVGMSGYNWELDFPNHIDRDHLWIDLFDWFDDFDPGYNDYSYACGFAYKTSALELLGCDYVWFNYHGNNGAPDYFFSRNPSHAYGHCGHPCRTLVWAKFRHKVSGTEFYFFVTHLPTKDQIAGDPDAYNVSGYSEARTDVSVQCIEVMYAEICEGLPCIMAGDMNRSETEDDGCYASLITYWDDAYNTVNAAGDLGSFYQTYSGTMSGEGLGGSGTPYHYDVLRFCKNHPERRYDQILTRKGSSLTARSYKTIRSANFIEDDTTFYPSDHLPVVSYITFD